MLYRLSAHRCLTGDDEWYEERAEICRSRYESSVGCLFKFSWRPLCRGWGWKNIYFCGSVLRSDLCCGIEVDSSQNPPRHALPHSPCLYVPALNLPPFYLKPQIGYLKMVPSFSCFYCSLETAERKKIKTSPFLRICAFLLALSFGSDINNDEFLIRRNKQLSKNVTHRHSESLFPPGASFESYLCRFLPVVCCHEDSRSLLQEPLFLASLGWRRINSTVSNWSHNKCAS